MFGGTFDLPRSGENLRTDMDVRNHETREAGVGLEVWKYGRKDDECVMDKMLDFWKKKKDELHK